VRLWTCVRLWTQQVCVYGRGMYVPVDVAREEMKARLERRKLFSYGAIVAAP
jgi:hypothetical protein